MTREQRKDVRSQFKTATYKYHRAREKVMTAIRTKATPPSGPQQQLIIDGRRILNDMSAISDKIHEHVDRVHRKVLEILCREHFDVVIYPKYDHTTVKNMTSNQRSLTAKLRHGELRSKVVNRASRDGFHVINVDEKGSSSTMSCCGCWCPPGCKKVVTCQRCGHQMDREENACYNIYYNAFWRALGVMEEAERNAVLEGFKRRMNHVVEERRGRRSGGVVVVSSSATRDGTPEPDMVIDDQGTGTSRARK